jgi:hypothetical protein
LTRQGDKNITSEVDNRLNSLFDDNVNVAEPNEPVKNTAVDHRTPTGRARSPELSPLFDLNAIILSIDWEITDEIMNQLLVEIERLKALFKKDKLPLMFLQLHGSVGKYISARKASAHPDSIKLLHSIYAGLDQTLSDSDMTEVEKKKILSVEVDKFKRLKEQILNAKTEGAAIRKRRNGPAPKPVPVEPPLPADQPSLPATASERPRMAPTSANGDPASISFDDPLEAAVNDLKQFIKEEMASLRMELKSLIEGD